MGARSSATALAVRRKKTPGRVLARGRPAESSTSIRHRFNSVVTRRAKFRSGVIRAAVLPGVSRTSRMVRAIVVASSRGPGQSIRLIPSKASSRELELGTDDGAAAGERAALIKCSRLLVGLALRCGHSGTSSRETPICLRSCAIPNCG